MSENPNLKKNEYFNQRTEEDGEFPCDKQLDLEKMLKLHFLQVAENSKILQNVSEQQKILPSFFEKHGRLILAVFSPILAIGFFLIGGYSNLIEKRTSASSSIESLQSEQTRLNSSQEKQRIRVREAELSVAKLQVGQEKIKDNLTDLKVGVGKLEDKIDILLRKLPIP